jgi:hypothetical protein
VRAVVVGDVELAADVEHRQDEVGGLDPDGRTGRNFIGAAEFYSSSHCTSLVSRFRSSQQFAAHSHANVGIEGH